MGRTAAEFLMDQIDAATGKDVMSKREALETWEELQTQLRSRIDAMREEMNEED